MSHTRFVTTVSLERQGHGYEERSVKTGREVGKYRSGGGSREVTEGRMGSCKLHVDITPLFVNVGH